MHFYSGQSNRYGRISEGLLLRRSHLLHLAVLFGFVRELLLDLTHLGETEPASPSVTLWAATWVSLIANTQRARAQTSQGFDQLGARESICMRMAPRLSVRLEDC